MTIPDLLIVGGHKCATTSMFTLLDRHPNISMSQVKEPHYWARDSLQTRLHQGVWTADSYAGLWRSDAGIRGEASTLYLYFAEEVCQRLSESRDALPKVVVSMRDPVRRAYSSYCDERLKNPYESAPDFETAIREELAAGLGRRLPQRTPTLNHIALGLYSEGVQTFQRWLGMENVHVMLFEDFREDAEREKDRILSFLGLQPIPGEGQAHHENRGAVEWRNPMAHLVARSRASIMARRALRRVSPRAHAAVRRVVTQSWMKDVAPIDSGVESILRDIYSEDIARLRELTGLDLDVWLG